MRLAYYHKSTEKFSWSRLWQGQEIGSSLHNAERAHLTKILLQNLPQNGKILEAGCGLGHYVILLRSKGFDVEGMDSSEYPVRVCKEYAPYVPVRVGDVRNIDVPDGYYKGYISLGVVEHFFEGPDEILREAWRVLDKEGVLLLSTPFINLVRLIFYPIIELEMDRRKKRGCGFYQYAFSKDELKEFLRRNGFVPKGFYFYGPGRMCRRVVGKVASRVAERAMKPSRGDQKKNLIDFVLYSRFFLNMFSHMILVVARKE